MVTDEMIKRAATEYLSHKGERPYRVTRRGAELWEDHALAIRAALEAALSAAEPVGLQWRHKGWTGGQWHNCPDGAKDGKIPDAEYRPVYASPTAPVDLKSLEDHVLADFTHLTDAQALSGPYIVKRIKDRFASFALSAQVQGVAGWQPIETAPRDGTEVLLYQEGQRNVARWLNSVVGPVWCTPDSHALYRPTLWMPLPAAPAKQEGGTNE